MTKIRCLDCGNIVVSQGHRHNFVECKCGKSFADGGDEYSRFGGINIEVLSPDYEQTSNSKKGPFPGIEFKKLKFAHTGSVAVKMQGEFTLDGIPFSPGDYLISCFKKKPTKLYGMDRDTFEGIFTLED